MLLLLLLTRDFPSSFSSNRIAPWELKLNETLGKEERRKKAQSRLNETCRIRIAHSNKVDKLEISYLRLLLMTGIEIKGSRIICAPLIDLISFGLFVDLLHIGWSYLSLIRRATSQATGRSWLIPISSATFAAGLWGVSDSVPPLCHSFPNQKIAIFQIRQKWLVNYEGGWGGGIGTVMI